ncbi:fibrinogen C domain-containing protein 1-like [Syngnathus typhle]|uniref:fibrinogen C domain-containing protein 1-like n=1 Tax=Syngnathus typhle TaxID=161592 RepID=UPI002A6ABA91|nr:fibrinogen C domain-containing protein 1-like [Syngnathus typhle]
MDGSRTTDDGVSEGASESVVVVQSKTLFGSQFQRPSDRRQDTTPWRRLVLLTTPSWRLFVQVRWSSILLVMLFIQSIVVFHLNRPQDIGKKLGALVATLPNSIPDRNCTDLACHWVALQTALAQLYASYTAIANDLEKRQTAFARLMAGQEAGLTALAELKASQEAAQKALAELKAGHEAGQTALAELKAGHEAGQTALAELKAGHGAISSDLEKSLTALAELKASHNAGQSLLAKVWQEISSDKGLLIQRLKDLKTDYKSMSRALSQENKDLISALSSLRQKVVDQPTLNRALHGLIPRDCSDIMAAGKSQSGVYTIFRGSNSFEAYCNMWQGGGGWTVIQRRKDGTVGFSRGWNDYRKGFGRLTGEHWLGLQNIHALTASGAYQLRIDFTAFDGVKYYALYNEFAVGWNSMDPDKDGYPLYVSGYSGNAGDGLTPHSGEKFTTNDRDQDKWDNGNCATRWDGAWWYEYCHWSNLNGLYKATGTCNGHNVVWNGLGPSKHTCLRFVEMKIRPRK